MTSDFILYQFARFFVVANAFQMQSVAVGLYVYELTRRPLDLGYTGLAESLPMLALSLVSGQVADRFDRRAVLLACYLAMTALSATLWATSGTQNVNVIFLLLVFVGVTRAFSGAASSALTAYLVPPEKLPRAIAISTTVWQVAVWVLLLAVFSITMVVPGAYIRYRQG